MHRRVPTGERYRAQVPHPPDARVRTEQQLTTPDRPVLSPAGAVTDDPQHRLVGGYAVLGEERGEVRVMVLHQHQRDVIAGSPPLGPRPRQIPGMQVGDDELW